MINEPARIGLCALGAIGDALLSSAILIDLKQQYPDARLTMIVSRSNAGIIPLIPHCDERLVLPLFSPVRAITMLRAQRFDLLIDANQWLRISAVYCALAGARHSVGFRTAGQYRHYAFDFVAIHNAGRHELDNYRALIATIGIVGNSRPRLHVSEPVSDPEVALLPSPYVVFHPWAGGGRARLKEWPTERWIMLGQELADRGYTIVVTGGPGDSEKAASLAMAAELSGLPMTMMAGRLNLTQTAMLLRSAGLVVSVNTGVMHMAAALDVPLVALHGPTNPDRWGPISDHAVSVLPHPVPPGVQVGYLNLGFEFPEDAPPCMEFIQVDSVLAAIDTVLESDGLGSHSSGARLVQNDL